MSRVIQLPVNKWALRALVTKPFEKSLLFENLFIKGYQIWEEFLKNVKDK